MCFDEWFDEWSDEWFDEYKSENDNPPKVGVLGDLSCMIADHNRQSEDADIDDLVPIIDVMTRWDSTFQMITRAIYLRKPLEMICLSEPSMRTLIPQAADWNLWQQLGEVYNEFEAARKILSVNKYPTITSALMVYLTLGDELQKARAKGDILESLTQVLDCMIKKFEKYQQKILVIPVYLVISGKNKYSLQYYLLMCYSTRSSI